MIQPIITVFNKLGITLGDVPIIPILLGVLIIIVAIGVVRK